MIKLEIQGRAAVAVKNNNRPIGREGITRRDQTPIIRPRRLPERHIFGSKHFRRRPLPAGKIKKFVLHITASQKYYDDKK